MPSMLDAMHEEMARIKKLLTLIAEDPKMEETILKFASEKVSSGAKASTNGHHKVTSAHKTPDEPAHGGMLLKTISFIRANGPSDRQEILEGTGMAGGSFSHFMRDSDKFNQREDGKWELKN